MIRQHVRDYAILSNRLTFSKGSFIAEASDLQDEDLYRQIYDDACDVGFGIKSVVTGKIVIYSFSKENKRDGETVSWEFIPIAEDIRKIPECKNTKVIIFND